jgi:hypothetical protein
VRYWLILSVMLCMDAFAGQPAPLPPDAPPQASDVPDDEFIEFLGEDDVGDAAWWEFLKNTTPRKEPPSAPQDAKR